jgi:hypothetical protein
MLGPAFALCALLAANGSAPGVDTIFIAERTTASVTIYAPPYSQEPITLPTGRYSNGEPPVALAFDPVSKRLFVGAGNSVQIYDEPFSNTSKPVRVVREGAPVLALAVEHRFYQGGLLEVATAGAQSGIQSYSGNDGYAGPARGRVDGVAATAMIFDALGHLFAADRRQSDGSILILWPLTGRAFLPPIAHFLLGPSALAFDRRGNLWAGNYDVDGDGTRSGVTSFAPPFSVARIRVADEGGQRGSGGGAQRLAFDADGALFSMQLTDVAVLEPPYDVPSAHIAACTDSSGACDPFDMTLDSRGNPIVAVRSLACKQPGAVLLFTAPFTNRQKPWKTLTRAVACPTAVVAAP